MYYNALIVYKVFCSWFSFFWGSVLKFGFEVRFWGSVLRFSFEVRFWGSVFEVRFWGLVLRFGFWGSVLRFGFEVRFWGSVFEVRFFKSWFLVPKLRRYFVQITFEIFFVTYCKNAKNAKIAVNLVCMHFDAVILLLQYLYRFSLEWDKQMQ